MRVVEILYTKEEDSTIEKMSYGYQVELDSHQYSYQTHLGSMDEFTLQYVNNKPYERQKAVLQTLK